MLKLGSVLNIGVSGIHPMPGRDYMHLPRDVPGRAIMQFNGLQAYLEEDEMVVLQKGVVPIGFHFDGANIYRLVEPSTDLVEKAIGHATWAADTYQNGSYLIDTVAKSSVVISTSSGRDSLKARNLEPVVNQQSE